MPWSSPADPGHLPRSPCSPTRCVSNPRWGGPRTNGVTRARVASAGADGRCGFASG
jgi:hypothetical protein